MGYTPRSARSAKRTIDLTVVPATTYTSTSLTLPKDKTFQASVDNVARDFVPDKDYTVAKTIVDGVAASFHRYCVGRRIAYYHIRNYF